MYKYILDRERRESCVQVGFQWETSIIHAHEYIRKIVICDTINSI